MYARFGLCTLNLWQRARAVSVRMGLYAVNHARGGASLTNSKHTERSQNSALLGAKQRAKRF